MEVELGLDVVRTDIGDNSVTSVVTAGTTCTDVDICSKDIRKFTLLA